MINKVTLIGHLGKDPEIRHLENGAAVTQFSVATSESYKDKSDEWQTNTEWHNIVCWRSLAERAENQLKKGNLVYIEGKISTRKWQDKEGIDRYSTDVIARTFRKLEKREDSGYNRDNDFPTVEEPNTNKSSDVADDVTGKDDLPF